MRTTTCRSSVVLLLLLLLAGVGGLVLPARAGAQRAASDTLRPPVVRVIVDTLRASTRAVAADAWLWQRLFVSDGDAASADTMRVAPARHAPRVLEQHIAAAETLRPARHARRPRQPIDSAAHIAYGDVRVTRAREDAGTISERTIFYRAQPGADSPDSGRVSALGSDRVQAPGTRRPDRAHEPRLADLLAAPYLAEPSELEHAGTVIVAASSDTTPPAARAANGASEILRHGDLVLLRAPQSHGAVRGARFFAYQLGPLLEGERSLVQPTAVLEVEAAATRQRPAVARVAAVFSELVAGQGVLPLPTVFADDDVPVLAAGSRLARVLWSTSAAASPDVVVLDLPVTSGFRPGDPVLLVERGETGGAGDRELGSGMLLRVNHAGASALITRRTGPRDGANLARVGAKLP